MATHDQKRIDRERRQRKLSLWLTTLSWSMPVMAFGGFLGVWHQLGGLVTPHTASKPIVNKSTNVITDTPLLALGSEGSQVSALQRLLAGLGYFNHGITGHYGSITADAVKVFQMVHHLPETGSVNQTTLSAIQHAAKEQRTSTLTVNPVTHHPSNTSPVSNNNTSSGNRRHSGGFVESGSPTSSHRSHTSPSQSAGTPGNVGLSQNTPVVTSSAS